MPSSSDHFSLIIALLYFMPLPKGIVTAVLVNSSSSQTIPLYGLEHTYETVTAKVDVYADVKYYRYRTRTVVKEAYTDYKWSSSQNDTGLTSQGYTYTGVKRVKEQ